MELREQVKLARRVHQNSYVELGRLLNEVVYGGDYKEWGYDDFETYCGKELGLKKATIQKLMVSYNYMRKYQPKKLAKMEEGGDVLLPSMDTVAALDKVERLDQTPQEEMKELRRQAFASTGEVEQAAVKKQINTAAKTLKEVDPDAREKAAILSTARKLRRVMGASHFVPDGLRERIERPLTELEALA